MIVLYMIKYRREGDIIRQKRIWYPGATYHAMARGIRRMVIFQDDTDYQVFLLLLKKMMEEHECSLHAYCLMSNHFHVLIETGPHEIGKTFKGIMSCYASYYNQRYGYHGHGNHWGQVWWLFYCAPGLIAVPLSLPEKVIVC